MGSSGDGIPSEPARQVTAEDNAERDKREAEKNATKASLNLQATAGSAAVPTATGKEPLETAQPEAGPKNYQAPAFDAPDSGNPKKVTPILESEAEFVRYKRQRTVNWMGMAVFCFYICALGFYLWIRIAKTLDLGQYLGYGIFVLCVEVMGATTVILYGTNLLWNPVNEIVLQESEDGIGPGKLKVRLPYHVRVLVPCYKESLEILRRTIMAAYDAQLPEGCSRTIYLCDDGKDPKKRKWVDSLASDVVYVSGRKRPAGEMNGKSGNINNVCSQMYPPGTRVPGSELICVFDADQVASKEFFMKTIPMFDGGDDVGMVLSPQCFHNLNLHSDIFNHSNVHFWEYMQPGYDTLGFISCTGTNFLVRSNALLEVGGSPQYTLTEDFALGMEMKKYGWHCRYVQEYLAIGEAPDQIRNCYQQRSRWCKGHFQIAMNKERCPLLQKRLSWGMRILYMSGVWSYIVGLTSTPTFIIIPLVTIWLGVFPIVVSWWAALGLTVYFIATNAVLYYVKSIKHIEALWFANCANQLLFWTYIKAFWRALNSVFGDKIQFKTTLKGASMLMNSAFRDLWVPGLCFVLLFATMIAGLIELFTGSTVSSPLAISVVWCVYNALPHFLVLWYVLVSKGISLQYLCRFCILLSFFCGSIAVGLIWGLYPRTYSFKDALNYSNFFLDAQKVGTLPVDNPVTWRSDAMTYELGPLDRDITGGYLQGGPAGNLKMTHPTAFSIALLAWGLLEFPTGYEKANATQDTMYQVRWGADYLMKMIGSGTGTDADYLEIIYQVGNYTTDQDYWGRPEDYTLDRPYYLAGDDVGATNLAATMTSALAATALVWKSSDTAYYTTLMTAAVSLYAYATKVYGAYGDGVQVPDCPNVLSAAYLAEVAAGENVTVCSEQEINLNGSAIALYNDTSYYDDLTFAATWLYKATGDTDYLSQAETWYVAHLYGTTSTSSDDFVGAEYRYDWMDQYWAANILLATLTDGGTFHAQAQTFLKMWVCGTDEVILSSPRGRAWNQYSPSLGSTMNVAFLAQVYSAYIKPGGGTEAKKAKRYSCWAQTQARYALGDATHSFIPGFGKDPPTHVQNQAASCPASPATCTAVNGLLNPDSNPRVLYGALVEAYDGDVDTWSDTRSLNMTRVVMEYNAGWQGLLAGLNELSSGVWEQCLQGQGIITKDHAVC
ncbi:TPA: hypothetical protein ACH3X3_002312 [Trebouxia sp. C0006]